MPAFYNHTGRFSVPRASFVGGPASFIDGGAPVYEERNYLVAGVTRDSSGVALGSCVVKLFNAASDTIEQSTTSDGSGNYSFNVDKTKSWYVIAYKAGSPDVTGATINTIAGA